jgi:hypothetical protein
LRVDALHARIRYSTFPMDRVNSRRVRLMSMARVLLASVLLTAFLSGMVPLASVSAGSMCNLECCAGRAPHASGSCMNGSCQATLTAHPAAKIHQAKPDQTEKFCGLARKIKAKNLARTRVKASRQTSPNQLLAAAFENPCQPDCGGCAAGFTNSKRQRNSAAIAGANRPRPPTDIHSSDFSSHRTRILKAQCRQGAPRGPPLSVS